MSTLPRTLREIKLDLLDHDKLDFQKQRRRLKKLHERLQTMGKLGEAQRRWRQIRGMLPKEENPTPTVRQFSRYIFTELRILLFRGIARTRKAAGDTS